MLRARVIPVLLLKNKGLVKTIKFDKSKYIGDPINAVKIFNDKEVDEIVVLDIEASKQNRKPNFELIKSIAEECFMPLGYGGGISELDDIKKLFALGVEKVIINNAALNDPKLITEAAKIFGDQSIVVCVDVTKNFWGKYLPFNHTKQKGIDKDILLYINEIISAGAGEIILNSVDLDGTMNGYDIKLIEKIANQISVPLVVCGGAGSLNDLKKAYQAGASGLAAGSIFVYHGPHKAVLINYPSQSQLKSTLN
ncbi:MAG: AglZ/HisF2 family acetamidino modification protein [Bacteroidota bacterium]